MRRLLSQFSGIIILSLLLFSCGKNTNRSAFDILGVVAEKVMIRNSELISCDLTKLKDTVDIPLSLFIEDLQMVKLDNRDEALVGFTFTTVTDKHILVRNIRQNPYKLFNIDGEFITTIGSFGQGPNEYQNVYDDWLDEETGQVFILPWQSNKLLRFDLQGNALEPIPLKYRVPKGKFFVNTKESTVSVFLLPFTGMPVVAWTQDFEGNMIDSIPAGHLSVPFDYSNEVYSNKNGEGFDCFLFTFFEQRPDSLYHYNMADNRLDPKFTLDFRDRPWKIHMYQELPLHFIGDVTVEKKLSDNITVTEHPSNFIVDKKTLKGGFYKLYNDFLGGIPMEEWPSFHNGYYVWNIEPGMLAEILTRHLEESETLTEKVRKELIDLLDSIDENENNYLFYGKLRQSPADGFRMQDNIYKNQEPTEKNIKSPKKTTSETVQNKISTTSKENTEDDRIYYFEDLMEINETPIFKGNPKEYFRNNNKYKDWNINDSKEVTLEYVVEKNGKASNIEIRKSSGNTDLDKEATRLIEEVMHLPGTDMKGEPIRCGNMMITVYFPPQ